MPVTSESWRPEDSNRDRRRTPNSSAVVAPAVRGEGVVTRQWAMGSEAPGRVEAEDRVGVADVDG